MYRLNINSILKLNKHLWIMVRNIKIAIYAMAKMFGLFAVSRRLTADFPRIVGYHGGCLGDEWMYNGLLFMRRETFAKRIEWLESEGFQLVTLDDALLKAGMKSGNRPLVVLTFDDGWYSTGRDLLPVLSQKKIPSLLYLSTKQFKLGGPIIPVTLGYLLWKAEKKVVNISGVGDGVDGVYDIRILTECNRLIRNVTKLTVEKQSVPNEIRDILHSIAAKAGVSPDVLSLESRRFNYLTHEEIKICADNGCTIQSHGHVHRYPNGDPDEFEVDLKQCSQVVEEFKLPSPKHYCYPSGSFDSMAAKVLGKVGLISATTCKPGLLKASESTEKYYLPRFLDGENIHMLEFQAEMSGFSEFMRRFMRARR